MRGKKQNNNRLRIGRLTAADNHNYYNDRIMPVRVLFGGGDRDFTERRCDGYTTPPCIG